MDMLERLYGGKGKPQPGPTIRRKPKKTDEKNLWIDLFYQGTSQKETN